MKTTSGKNTEFIISVIRAPLLPVVSWKQNLIYWKYGNLNYTNRLFRFF